MDFVEGRLEHHDLAVQGHVAGEGLPVDIIAEALGDGGAEFGVKLFGKVGGAAILACIVFERGSRLLKVIAVVSIEAGSKLAMLADEPGKVAHGLERSVFRKMRAFEAFVIVDCLFLGIGLRAGAQHRRNFAPDFVWRRRIDPAPVQASVVVNGKARDVDAWPVLNGWRTRSSKGFNGSGLVSHVCLLPARSFPHQAEVGGEKAPGRSA